MRRLRRGVCVSQRGRGRACAGVAGTPARARSRVDRMQATRPRPTRVTLASVGYASVTTPNIYLCSLDLCTMEFVSGFERNCL